MTSLRADYVELLAPQHSRIDWRQALLRAGFFLVGLLGAASLLAALLAPEMLSGVGEPG